MSPGHCSLPTASTARPRDSLPCCSLPATQSPSQQLKSRAAGPFLSTLTSSVSLPLAALNKASIPVGPSGFSLPRIHTYNSVALVRSPPLPPSTCRIGPLLVPSSFASRVSGSPILMPVLYRNSRPCVAPSLVVFWCLLIIGLFSFECPLLAGGNPGRLHSLDIARPSP